MLLPTNGSDDRDFENVSATTTDVRTDFFEKITRRKNSYATWNSYVPHFIISVHYGSKSIAFHKKTTIMHNKLFSRSILCRAFSIWSNVDKLVVAGKSCVTISQNIFH